jgi:hypothetical protein
MDAGIVWMALNIRIDSKIKEREWVMGNKKDKG